MVEDQKKKLQIGPLLISPDVCVALRLFTTWNGRVSVFEKWVWTCWCLLLALDGGRNNEISSLQRSQTTQKEETRAHEVVQCLRICLSMQGIRI